MAGLSYAGPNSANSTDVMAGSQVNSIISTFTPNVASATAQANALIDSTGGYVSKNYVDTHGALYVTPTQVSAQTALLVPTAQVGVANGVAALDSTSKVPIAQMPNMGVGYVRGSWGPTSTSSGSVTTGQLKIADWNIGLSNYSFRPFVNMLAFVTGPLGFQPVIEVWMTNTTTAPTTYPLPGGSLLVAQGVGRWGYADYHTITVGPTPDTTGETQSNLSPSYNVWLTAWLYDLNGIGATLSAGNIASGSAILLRGAQ